ncbi:unnamed protein product [Bursaphelenchus okinawaensis]|uniref:Uncharacterized protein n=1 Tax=Bursaphelenchus okinawaensis TaxID=465554 RepID=A0A811KQ28_9BILA|nr:unnamed protein product [Bursaphelenchus okinawaensis]CAG9107744.1 unnamed protein product [Bursaphelenchus okinawaensis]
MMRISQSLESLQLDPEQQHANIVDGLPGQGAEMAPNAMAAELDFGIQVNDAMDNFFDQDVGIGQNDAIGHHMRIGQVDELDDGNGMDHDAGHGVGNGLHGQNRVDGQMPQRQAVEMHMPNNQEMGRLESNREAGRVQNPNAPRVPPQHLFRYTVNTSITNLGNIQRRASRHLLSSAYTTPYDNLTTGSEQRMAEPLYIRLTRSLGCLSVGTNETQIYLVGSFQRTFRPPTLGSIVLATHFADVVGFRPQLRYPKPSGVITRYTIVSIPDTRKSLAIISNLINYPVIQVQCELGVFPAHAAMLRSQRPAVTNQPLVIQLSQILDYKTVTENGTLKLIRASFSNETLFVSAIAYSLVDPFGTEP